MARNKSLAVVGDFLPAVSVGPVSRSIYQGVKEYVEQNGGLAIAEMAARGALTPAFFALLKMGLELEGVITQADEPPASHTRAVVSPIRPAIVRAEE
jgi:hypothetical protein